MHDQFVHRLHWHQRPPSSDVSGLSTAPSPRTRRRFLNGFLRPAVLRWRLRGVPRIPPELFFQFGNRQLQLSVLIHQAAYHRLDAARQRCPFGFGQTFDRWLLRAIHEGYSTPLRSPFSTPVNAYYLMSIFSATSARI